MVIVGIWTSPVGVPLAANLAAAAASGVTRVPAASWASSFAVSPLPAERVDQGPLTVGDPLA